MSLRSHKNCALIKVAANSVSQPRFDGESANYAFEILTLN